ncbi:predicted protein [Aspergillus nidulans FGSC A4]|uniref:Uncharacterized protein n=1 Tax=Emericella nidulans (strain FGSC A4 / ATCC 38163 / CBS 112.46 / NRRL 194 / M139) TaxID=227321 RepID=Q5AT12_EMENI|nr:hypothetical protein [Aspergillus nidulans FGSC A4]EAA66993.1 predicted protein [Aspergillus nidulans FGSC A4]CBF80817.1 TPA: conserved hypothetical protein [Aspergillus nidulans FGSC A4]|eukprot:XP_681837.1 predicted protein [Aspergillus nidulans FGSC A4]
MHTRDRLRLSILPQNAEEPVQYEEFVREQIARDDKEWKRLQETCDRVFDQHLQSHEALRRAKAVLEAENADLKQQILDLNRELEEEAPVTAELRQKLEEVTAERNEMALRLARKGSHAMSVVSATSAPKSHKIADPEQLSDGKEDPKFEEWLLAMERKLTVNADRFPTEYGKITYILSRTARTHTRLEKKSSTT